MNLIFKKLFFLFFFISFESLPSSNISFTFDSVNFYLPSGYHLNLSETFDSHKVTFLRYEALDGIKYIGSQIVISERDKCQIYCQKKHSKISPLTLKEDIRKGDNAFFIWEVKGSNNINNELMTVGVLYNSRFAVIIIDDIVTYKNWKKKVINQRGQSLSYPHK